MSEASSILRDGAEDFPSALWQPLPPPGKWKYQEMSWSDGYKPQMVEGRWTWVRLSQSEDPDDALRVFREGISSTTSPSSAVDRQGARLHPAQITI
jgi:hypothetical protein